MKELPYPDRHHVNAATGWLELGCPAEAAAELSRMSALSRFHPEAMIIRWKLHGRGGHWQRAADLARIFTQLMPNQPSGWICLAYSLFRLSRPLEAWLQLMPRTRVFPKVSAIPYMLACLASQMGHEKEAGKWLVKSGELGGPTQVTDDNFDTTALALLSPRVCTSVKPSKTAPTARAEALPRH